MDLFENFDDLGIEGGDQFDEFGGFARQKVLSWQPKAVGKRPMDWAKRDLVYGRSRSDWRNWQLRSLLKNKPPYLFAGTSQLNDKDRKVVANSRAFQFVQYLKLFRLCNELEQDPVLLKIQSLLACPPALFEVRKQGRLLRNCELGHLCPFCVSRKAAVVCEHIRSFLPQAFPTVLSKVSISKKLPLNWERGLAKSEKSIAFGKLKKVATEMGGDGGLLTFQVAPVRQEIPRVGNGEVLGVSEETALNFHASLVTEVSQDFVQRNCRHPENLSIHDLSKPEELSGYNANLVVAVANSPIPRSIDGLRYLLFGKTSHVCDNSGESPINGAFANHQLHLANLNQWRSAELWTRNMKLYQYFGTWKPSKPNEPKKLVNVNARSGKSRQVMSLQRANYGRQQNANLKAIEDAERMRAVFEDLSRRLNRRPGWRPLQDACSQVGLEFSQRETRRALKKLKEETNV